MGEKIKSFDVSLDGKWVIATCTTYLLVFTTEMANGKTGFEG
jgi:VID27 C-terminal WD40-like domain